MDRFEHPPRTFQEALDRAKYLESIRASDSQSVSNDSTLNQDSAREDPPGGTLAVCETASSTTVSMLNGNMSPPEGNPATQGPPDPTIEPGTSDDSFRSGKKRKLDGEYKNSSAPTTKTVGSPQEMAANRNSFAQQLYSWVLNNARNNPAFQPQASTLSALTTSMPPRTSEPVAANASGSTGSPLTQTIQEGRQPSFRFSGPSASPGIPTHPVRTATMPTMANSSARDETGSTVASTQAKAITLTGRQMTDADIPNQTASSKAAEQTLPFNHDASDNFGTSGLAPLLSQLSLSISVLKKDISSEIANLRETLLESREASASVPKRSAVSGGRRRKKGVSGRNSSTMVDEDAEMIDIDAVNVTDEDDVDKGHDDDDDDDDDDDNDDNGLKTDLYASEPQITNFRDKLRRHVLRLLKISSTDELDQAPPPPTKEELRAFNRRAPDCIKISAADFRLDLTSKRTSPFNRAAQEVFADDFRKKVLQEGFYHFPPIPEKYMEREYIIFYLQQHMKHLRKIYRELVLSRDPAAKPERLRKSARSNRKIRLYKARLAVLANNPGLAKHRKLLTSVRSQGMSSDESDVDESGRSRFKIITPPWRSVEFTGLCVQLDAERAAQRALRVGHRRVRGNAPRERIRPDPPIYNTTAVAPISLPRNCYSAEWYETLRPFEKKSLKRKRVDYDFSLEPPRRRPPPSGALASDLSIHAGANGTTA